MALPLVMSAFKTMGSVNAISKELFTATSLSLLATLEVAKEIYERLFEADNLNKWESLEEALKDASPEEIGIYKDVGLTKEEFMGREALIRTDIDLDSIDHFGQTNLERMKNGLPPLVDGKPIELHHIGQKANAPLAELTWEEHRGKGNDSILHVKGKETAIDRDLFSKERKEHWMSRANQIESGRR
jgi:hypothetical protein